MIRHLTKLALENLRFERQLHEHQPTAFAGEEGLRPPSLAGELLGTFWRARGCLVGLHRTVHVAGGEDGPRGHKCVNCDRYVARARPFRPTRAYLEAVDPDADAMGRMMGRNE